MIRVADNLQITHPIIHKAVLEFDPIPIQETVRQCEAAGAEAIDINSGPLLRDPEKTMRFLVEAVQDATNLPILIDTANPIAMEAGLRANRGSAMINSFSLEPIKLERILPLATRYDVDIIGYLLYPDGHVPPDSDERLSIAVQLFEAYRKTGLDPERLIIDPIIPPILWQNGRLQASEVLTVIRMLPEVLGFPVKTIAALSNLTTGKGNSRKKRLLEQAYLPMLAASGLSYILMNVFHAEIVSIARTCRAIFSTKVFTWEDVY